MTTTITTKDSSTLTRQQPNRHSLTSASRNMGKITYVVTRRIKKNSINRTPQEMKKKVVPSYTVDNIQKLTLSFEKELINIGNELKATLKRTKHTFEQTANSIGELPFSACAVEITPNNAIKFTLPFSNDRLLIVTKPLDFISGLDDTEVVFSFFINRELIITNAAKISTFVEDFNEFFSL